MKKIIMIMMLFVSVATKGQELMKIIDIKPLDTISYGYVYNDATTQYDRVFVFWNKNQPELDNYLTLVKSTYLASNDTITRLLYQNASASGGEERFIIYTTKLEEPIVLYMAQLSAEIQQSVGAFGIKFYTNYKIGYYYGN